jgi:hypothetical protein
MTVASPELAWRALNARRAGISLLALLVLAGCFAVDVATGPALLPLAQVARTLVGLTADPMVNAIVSWWQAAELPPRDAALPATLRRKYHVCLADGP